VTDAAPFGDALTAPFWEAAARGELVVQRCRSCGAHQFYPRPFCLACDGDGLEWVATAGTGTVYALTTVHLRVDPALEPPYAVAVVELDEGPRLVTNLVGAPATIGDRVTVGWRERDGMPPLPVFEPQEGSA
jgi:uncharacterized protein